MKYRDMVGYAFQFDSLLFLVTLYHNWHIWLCWRLVTFGILSHLFIILYHSLKFWVFHFKVLYNFLKSLNLPLFSIENFSYYFLIFEKLISFFFNPLTHSISFLFKVFNLSCFLSRELIKFVILNKEQRIEAFNHHLQGPSEYRFITINLFH